MSATAVTVTPRQREALADALTKPNGNGGTGGHIWRSYPHSTGDAHHYSARLLNKLIDLGLIAWEYGPVGSCYGGGYGLTATGRALILAEADAESSASRQHHIDTGRYLTYGDRPEHAGPGTAHELPLQLLAIRTPKGNVWHLVDTESTESDVLCGRFHGVNTRYIKVGSHLADTLRSSDAADCKKCLAAAATMEN